MAYSRLGRYEEKKQIKRLAWSIGGSIAILLFIGLFGLKLLEGFSLLVGKFKTGSGTTTDTPSALLLPPTLDDTFEATNTAIIKVGGKGDSKQNIIVYVNEEEKGNVTIGDNGTFTIDSVKLKEGANTISVKTKDDKGNISDLSNVLHITFKKTAPVLQLDSPSDKTNIIGEKNTVSVSGKTDDDTTVSVNGRVVVTGNGGSFSYDYPLKEGTNTIKVLATDQAGNQTTVERTVTYQK